MIEKMKEKEKEKAVMEPSSEKKSRKKSGASITTNNFNDCYEYMHSKRKRSGNGKRSSSVAGNNNLNFLSKIKK